ncbi:MAG: hypothetical protein P8177_15125 [Gemmatimonadota bacterium]|jgi:hypothetical protein
MRVSHTVLRVLSAATWYVGGLMLLFKGGGYLAGAAASGATLPAALAGGLGVTAGVLRGRTMFLRACRRNLARIDALERPRVWQFFRPGFFAALVLMIAAGALLSRVAGSGYWPAVVVGGLELVIATALLSSSTPFWGWSEAQAAR